MTTKSSFMTALQSKQEERAQQEQPQEQPSKKTVFDMADEATEDYEEESSYQEEEAPEYSAEDLVSRYENNEELTQEEMDYLVAEGYAEETEQEEEEDFDPPSDSEKIKNLFPDREFKSAKDFENARNELYDNFTDTQSRLNEMSKTTQTISKVLTENPEMQAIIKALDKGVSVRAALIEAGFSPEDFQVMEDDDDAEDMIEAKVNAREQQRIREQQQKEFEQNITESERVISALNIDDSQREKLYEKISSVYQDYTRGKISQSTIQSFLNDLNFDSSIKKAVDRTAREVRNEKIKLIKKKSSGDGLPRLTSKAVRTPKKTNGDPFLSSLSQNFASRPSSFAEMAKRNK